jgi:hypothetical protein
MVDKIDVVVDKIDASIIFIVPYTLI